MSSNKVGASEAAAGDVVKKQDFGAKAGDHPETDYVSRETAKRDPGHGTVRAGTDGGRTAGVGGNDSGRGSSSGGDIDTGADALIGIGDPSQKTPKNQDQTGGDRLDPLPTQMFGTPDGNVSDESSSAADVNDERDKGNSFKGDVTPGEAAG